MPSAPIVIHQQVVSGDDCLAADGRSLTWTSQDWPNLAGATLTMVVGHNAYNLFANLPVFWTGTVPATPASPTTVSLDVTAAETSALPPTEYDYVLQSVLADGDHVTIAQGKLSVIGQPGIVPLFPPGI